MHACLGRVEDLDALLKSVKTRVFMGSATEKIVCAWEGLHYMKTAPGISFRCGPLALHQIMVSTRPEDFGAELIARSVSTPSGCSLSQIAALSQELGLNYQMVFRAKDTPFVVPSIVHLKVNHYAALVRREGDRYLLQDPTFGNDVWVTCEALEEETSGYFLVPPGELAVGWRNMSSREGETVWGKGNAPPDPKPHGPCDHKSSGGGSCDDDPCPQDKGMAVPRVHLAVVSLNFTDEPVGYSPPIGPAVNFMVRYNQREAN